MDLINILTFLLSSLRLSLKVLVESDIGITTNTRKSKKYLDVMISLGFCNRKFQMSKV